MTIARIFSWKFEVDMKPARIRSLFFFPLATASEQQNNCMMDATEGTGITAGRHKTNGSEVCIYGWQPAATRRVMAQFAFCIC